MTPPTFRTDPLPIHNRKAAHQRQLQRREAGGIASLWMDAMNAGSAKVLSMTGTDGMDWKVWRYRNTLNED